MYSRHDDQQYREKISVHLDRILDQMSDLVELAGDLLDDDKARTGDARHSIFMARQELGRAGDHLRSCLERLPAPEVVR